MKKIFMSLAALAILASCNEKKDNVTPTYPTTNVNCSVNVQGINPDGNTTCSSEAGENESPVIVNRKVPAYIKGIVIDATCPNRIDVENRFLFEEVQNSTKNQNIILRNIFLGSNTFTASIVRNEKVSWDTYYAGELKSDFAIQEFTDLPITATCDPIFCGPIKIDNSLGNKSKLNANFGLMKCSTGAVKILLNPGNRTNYKVELIDADKDAKTFNMKTDSYIKGIVYNEQYHRTEYEGLKIKVTVGTNVTEDIIHFKSGKCITYNVFGSGKPLTVNTEVSISFEELGTENIDLNYNDGFITKMNFDFGKKIFRVGDDINFSEYLNVLPLGVDQSEVTYQLHNRTLAITEEINKNCVIKTAGDYQIIAISNSGVMAKQDFKITTDTYKKITSCMIGGKDEKSNGEISQFPIVPTFEGKGIEAFGIKGLIVKKYNESEKTFESINPLTYKHNKNLVFEVQKGNGLYTGKDVLIVNQTAAIGDISKRINAEYQIQVILINKNDKAEIISSTKKILVISKVYGA